MGLARWIMGDFYGVFSLFIGGTFYTTRGVGRDLPTSRF